MKKNLKRLAALAMAGAMALSLAGCGGGGSSSGSADAQGTTAAEGAAGEAAADAAATALPVSATEITVPEGESVSQETDVVGAMLVDFTTMDPMDTSDTLSGGIQRLIMDGFFGFDDEMEIIPMLAESYEANDDATEYTLHLRQGISFSDGTPFDAEAAKANLDRWGDENLGLKRTTLLCNVIDSTEIIDDYTVKIHLQEPFGAFIATLAHPACVLMSPQVIAQGNDACAENPVGTGQYTFVEWVAGDHATVELNKDWWGYDPEICGGEALAESDAGFKSITFRPVAENATRVAMLQAGDADFIWPVPTESMATLAQDTSVYVGAEEGIVVRYLFMNNQKAPFNDVRVRQAMNYAINKDAYVAVVKNGLASPATSIMGPATQHYKANDPYEYNPEKAKELLAEAGYPDGFETTLICSSTTTNLKQAEFLQQQLAQVGITMNINSLESAVVNDTVENVSGPGAEAEVELYIIGWSSSTGDADWAIRPLLAIESEPPMSYNICYYENEEFDNLLYEALATADESVRAEKYAEAQDIVWEDCPLVCLANDYNTWATSNKIANVKVFPDNCLNVRNARMLQ
ncbi:MAG: glutathione ABC transporter substrate-binding protein [Candidatus Avilachnospira sp.]|jgi:glutathione transport system substrate-binding protein